MSSSSLSRVLDLEAARRGDVLEVDAAEARRQPGHGLDDLVDVGGVQADRHGVDAAELLEQHGLALHHRHRGRGPDVAEPEHRGAVGDDRDGVRDPGVVVGQRRVGRDRLADPGHTGRVGERQVVGAVQRDRRDGSPSCRRRAGRRPGRRRAGADGLLGAMADSPGIGAGRPLARGVRVTRFGRGGVGAEHGRWTRGAAGSHCAQSRPQRAATARPGPPPPRARAPRRRAPGAGVDALGPGCRSAATSRGAGGRRRRSAARLTASVPSAKRATTTAAGTHRARRTGPAAGRRRAASAASTSPCTRARPELGGRPAASDGYARRSGWLRLATRSSVAGE